MVPNPTSTKLPFVVYLLMLGTFLMCTTEYIIAGLLPEMAADLQVSVAQAGLLITAFAVGMIVGSPTMSIATLRLPRRWTFVLALVVFAVGHVVAALSGEFGLVLAARVLTALATGAFWAVASVVATTAAGPARSTRALGVMTGGAALSTVIGVPLGSFVGQAIGWRGTFWGLAVLAAVAAVVIGQSVPRDEHQQAPSVRRELQAMRSGRIWLLFAATALVTGGAMAAFSYITPLLTDWTGLTAALVPLILVIYGVGALVGTQIAGRLGDRKPLGTFIGATVGVVVVLVALTALSAVTVPTVILAFGLGVAGMAVPPIATGLTVRFAGSAPTLAASVAVAGFNVGIAIGSWTGGLALDSALGLVGPSVIGAVMAALGLIPLLVLAGKRATSTTGPTTDTDTAPVTGSAEPVAVR